jgi:hypothetical protein
METEVKTDSVWYWVTYDHYWGRGKVHQKSCRFADNDLNTGRWVHAERVAVTRTADCGTCGGRVAKGKPAKTKSGFEDLLAKGTKFVHDGFVFEVTEISYDKDGRLVITATL